MKSFDKVDTHVALSHSSTSSDAASALDLARLVRQPRTSVSAHGAVTARLLVGALIPIEEAGQTYLCIEVNGESVPVQVADSCLVRVDAGDWVHALMADGLVWVLSVLQKSAAQAGAPRQLDFGESELHISAKKICMRADQLIDMHAPLLTQAAKTRQCQIEGTDSARVGNSVVHADSHLSIHARSAMVTAASLLKVDAAQIHMG